MHTRVPGQTRDGRAIAQVIDPDGSVDPDHAGLVAPVLGFEPGEHACRSLLTAGRFRWAKCAGCKPIQDPEQGDWNDQSLQEKYGHQLDNMFGSSLDCPRQVSEVSFPFSGLGL